MALIPKLPFNSIDGFQPAPDEPRPTNHTGAIVLGVGAVLLIATLFWVGHEITSFF